MILSQTGISSLSPFTLCCICSQCGMMLQELRTLWSRYISFFLYELRWTVPYTEMRKDPVCMFVHESAMILIVSHSVAGALCAANVLVGYIALRDRPSRDHKSSNVCPMKSRASPAMQFMLRRSLGLLEGMLRQRDSVLRKLKMGDFRKVFRFTRMILGQPRNWLLTGMSWVRAHYFTILLLESS